MSQDLDIEETICLLESLGRVPLGNAENHTSSDHYVDFKKLFLVALHSSPEQRIRLREGWEEREKLWSSFENLSKRYPSPPKRGRPKKNSSRGILNSILSSEPRRSLIPKKSRGRRQKYLDDECNFLLDFVEYLKASRKELKTNFAALRWITTRISKAENPKALQVTITREAKALASRWRYQIDRARRNRANK